MNSSEKIFKNRFLLNFNSSQMELKFSYYLQEHLQKYNFCFSIIGLIISLMNTIYESIFYEKLKGNSQHPYIEFTRIVSYIVTGIFIIQTSLVCIVKNFNFQKIVVYINFLLIIFPFNDFRELLFNEKLIEHNLFSMMRILELIIRVCITLLLLVAAPESYILNLLYLIISSAYVPFVSGSLGVYTYISVAIILTLISYFYTKQVKISFYTNSTIQEQNEWFSNLLDHMNSGFLAFNRKNIKFINKNLHDLIWRIKKVNHKNSWNIENIGENPNYAENVKKKLNKNVEENVSLHVFENKLSLNTDQKYSFKNIELNKFQENPESDIKSPIVEENEQITKEILSLLLNNISKEYSTNSSTITNEINFSMDYFLREAKNVYRDSKMNQKFLMLGYKEFVLHKEKVETYLNIENTEKTDLNFPSAHEKQEILNFEVYFRCHLKESIDNIKTKNDKNYSQIIEDEEFEIFFNDITKIKIIEQKSAELKFKSKFLSKISHEFKNPLICISELTELICQEKSSTQTNQLREINYKYLRQIKSLSDYLLILIKDLNYFSFANLGIEIRLEKQEANFEEILEFCKNIGEVLILKI
jgi:hypothetical protein